MLLTMFKLYILGIIILSLNPCQCIPICSCDGPYSKIICNDKGYTSISCDRSIDELEFRNNSLTELNQLIDVSISYELDVSNNKINSIRVSLDAKFLGIRALNLSHNSLSTITNSTFSLFSYLGYLDLSYNDIKHIDANSFDMPLLVTLMLSYNPNIQSVNVLEFHEAIYLYLNGCNLTSLDFMSYRYNPHLADTLDLSNNRLTEIPTEIWDHLIMLNTLDISNNIITHIDEEIDIVSDVESLNLTQNSISSIDFLISFPHLKYLYLAHNKIDVVDSFRTSKLHVLEYLDLSYNNIKVISTVPRSIKILSIVGNHIENTAFLANSSSIVSLDLSRNNITNATFARSGFRYLRDVDISCNNISSLELHAFESLRVLKASNNIISEIMIRSVDTHTLNADLSNNRIKTMDFLLNMNRSHIKIDVSGNWLKCEFVEMVYKKNISDLITFGKKDKPRNTVNGIGCDGGEPFEVVENVIHDEPIPVMVKDKQGHTILLMMFYITSIIFACTLTTYLAYTYLIRKRRATTITAESSESIAQFLLANEENQGTGT